MAKPKTQSCRWRQDGKPCPGTTPKNGGRCDVCGHHTPGPPKERNIATLTVRDGDGEIRLNRTIEVREVAEWEDLAKVMWEMGWGSGNRNLPEALIHLRGPMSKSDAVLEAVYHKASLIIVESFE